MTPPDKRRAMIVFLRDFLDFKMQAVGSMIIGLRESGRHDLAEKYLRDHQIFEALFLQQSMILKEHEDGIFGKYGVPRAVTNIISAGESAYYKEKKA